MAQQFLSTQSPYTFSWHENSGQVLPDDTKDVKSSIGPSGITIHIEDKAVVADPIILLNSSALNNKSKNIINVGKNAQVQIIEYLMCDDDNSSNTVSTTINCAECSYLKHCILQHSASKPSITQQSTTTILQDSDSSVVSNVFSFGGGVNNIALSFELQGNNAECQAACLSFTNNSEVQNISLKIDHKHENCTSKCTSRGVMKDKSITDFIGKIIVHPGAKKSCADLQIKNLLCSPKAQNTNKPELEIYNDDVRCSHGSTTGQLDKDALFYMRSRGIDEVEATSMLIAGFIKPVIDSCTIPMIASYVHNLVADR